MNSTALAKRFRETFKQEPILIRAPGRVNIIGEHTDYNEGFVLPFPISNAINFAVSPRIDNEFCLQALDIDESISFNLDNLENLPPWVRYFKSVIQVLLEDNYQFKGMNLISSGNIPFGAGVSSSSALTCGFIYAISLLYDLGISKREIVFIASRAENQTGINGGKMDQFSICIGQKSKALFIDCKDYSYKLVNNNIKGAQWFLFNSNVEHNLANTEYNERRKDCESALAAIQKENPEIKSLRNIDSDSLKSFVNVLNKKQYKRLSHIVYENKRVFEMVKVIESGDPEKAGNLLYQSHESLAQLYEVSCDELDFIVNYLKNQDYCFGARMMGGGFGGSVIALLKNDVATFNGFSEEYYNSFNLVLDIIPVISDNGLNTID